MKRSENVKNSVEKGIQQQQKKKKNQINFQLQTHINNKSK